MSLLSFVKEAGEKLFGRGQAQAAMTEVKADPANEAKIAAANAAAGDAILDYIKAQNLAATGLTVTFDGATSTVSVFGVAPDQVIATKRTGANAPAQLTRPLCPYPQVARYKGSGSTDEAANFNCVMEQTGQKKKK